MHEIHEFVLVQLILSTLCSHEKVFQNLSLLKYEIKSQIGQINDKYSESSFAKLFHIQTILNLDIMK